jgi:nucleoside-diphosphate-sugar epimerase
MDVLVAGGHGQIARRLLRLLAQQGHTARGLIRNPAHVADLEADGALGVLCDLETDDVRPHIEAHPPDALVFAAGAGPGSGDARKRTMDLGGAVKCIEAAEELGVDRFLMVSSMGTRDIPSDGPMKPYLEAKRDADLALEDSGLRWTIVRPGGLTNEPGSGRVLLAPVIGHFGQVPRDDVARVLYECLFAENTVHGSFELLAGSAPVESAVRSFTSR